jgi:hypothetical protein
MKKWIIIDNEMLQGGFWERFPGLSCKMIYNENRNTKKENAALISSAPELLEALKSIPMECNHKGKDHIESCWVCKAHNAILKAENKDK